MSWKAVTEGATNALRFATEDEAQRYGGDLYLRWTACPSRPVPTECDDEVTHVWTDIGLAPVGAPEDAQMPVRRVQL